MDEDVEMISGELWEDKLGESFQGYEDSYCTVRIHTLVNLIRAGNAPTRLLPYLNTLIRSGTLGIGMDGLSCVVWGKLLGEML